MKKTLSQGEHVVEVCRPGYHKLDILAYITDFCNYRCWYCYNKPVQEKKTIDAGRLVEYVQFVKNRTGRDIELELIGGEPSVHPDILRLCREASIISDVVLYTNYSLDFSVYQEMIERGVVFDITYHQNGDTRNKKVLENIRKTPKDNIRGINVMVDRKHFHENMEVLHELRKCYPDIDVDLQQVIIGTEVDQYSEAQILEMDRFVEENNDMFFELRTNKRKIMASHNQIYEITGQKYKRWVCNAGLDLIYVHVDGSIYVCDGYFNGRKNPIGNIYEHIFKFPGKSTLCEVENCPFQDNVTKRKVFR